MRVLRVFYTRHRLAQKHYHNTKEHRDFDEDTHPEAAYKVLFEEEGSLLDSRTEVTVLLNQRVKIAPDQYITIHSHAVIEPHKGEPMFQGERVTERDLFPASEIRAFTKTKGKR